MFHNLSQKIKHAGDRLGNKTKSVYREGVKFVNNPIVQGAVVAAGAVAGGIAMSGNSSNKTKELQQSTNINNTGIGADYFKIPGAPNVKPFTEEAFPEMRFRE
tara:strand:+ start:2146 stop:2454 length:309 start_codon:yes stop_codon:yes gene_type:complete